MLSREDNELVIRVGLGTPMRQYRIPVEVASDVSDPDAAGARRGLHEFVDRAGRHALDVGFLDDGGERLLGHAAVLETRPSLRPMEVRAVTPTARIANNATKTSGP